MINKKNKLIGIGYWHSCYEPDMPDPAKFIDKNWDNIEKQFVIKYLKKGLSVADWMGISWCRFRCGETNMGARCLTDGTYIYPEGLVHYIEKHGVRLPKKFVEHVLNEDGNDIVFDKNQNYETDFSWWKKEIGFDFSKNEKSFLASTDKEIENHKRRANRGYD